MTQCSVPHQTWENVNSLLESSTQGKTFCGPGGILCKDIRGAGACYIGIWPNKGSSGDCDNYDKQLCRTSNFSQVCTLAGGNFNPGQQYLPAIQNMPSQTYQVENCSFQPSDAKSYMMKDMKDVCPKINGTMDDYGNCYVEQSKLTSLTNIK
jgi:hypothetical protein